MRVDFCSQEILESREPREAEMEDVSAAAVTALDLHRDKQVTLQVSNGHLDNA